MTTLVGELVVIMEKQLSQREIAQENVYNMDETILLHNDSNAVNVLVSRNDARKCRGVVLRRTIITAVECILAHG